jgi:hypothetical protein
MGIIALVRLAHVVGRGSAVLRRTADAALQGVRLGMLDRAGINGVTAAFYARSTARYYDDTYNERGLFEWEQSVIERYFAGVKKLLLGSAGAGREMLALSTHGFSVSAFECSPLLIEEARGRLARAGIATPLVLAAPDDVPMLGTFDGAILGWAPTRTSPAARPALLFCAAYGLRSLTAAPSWCRPALVGATAVGCASPRRSGRRYAGCAVATNPFRSGIR